jgi:tryptophan-rich sensory protein
MRSLIVWIVLCFGAAAVGSRFMPGPWYASLRKPPWNPPDWVFGPVWTVLYLLMAVAAWRVWQSATPAERRLPIALFLVQLVLNAAWSWVFFGIRAPGPAFAHILVLWLMILLTALSFRRVDRATGLLMLPYLAWVSFAAVLNGTIWRLNP